MKRIITVAGIVLSICYAQAQMGRLVTKSTIDPQTTMRSL